MGRPQHHERPLRPFPWFDLVLILALIALTASSSMSELAIVSSREARLQAMAKSGSAGRAMRAGAGRRPGPLPVDGADRHHADRDPRRRLFGREPRRAGGAAARACLGLEPDTAQTVGFGIVIVLTTFAVAGHRRAGAQAFALRTPEPIAAIVARPMNWLSKVTAPFVWLLDQHQRADLPAARAQPREQECRHRRGTAPGRRRGADRRRARGKRAGDHLGHRPPRRPPGARGHDPAHRHRLDRHRLHARGNPRRARRDAAQPAARSPRARSTISSAWSRPATCSRRCSTARRSTSRKLMPHRRRSSPT